MNYSPAVSFLYLIIFLRTYFFCGNSEKLSINYAKQDMPSGTLYHVLRVKISDISPDFPMFCDPLIKDNAIYIEFSIVL